MAGLFPPTREQEEEIEHAFSLITVRCYNDLWLNLTRGKQDGNDDYVDFHRVNVVLKAMGMQPRKGELQQVFLFLFGLYSLLYEASLSIP